MQITYENLLSATQKRQIVNGVQKKILSFFVRIMGNARLGCVL